AERHGSGCLGNQVSRAGADDVDSENTIAFFVRQHFDKSFGLGEGPRAAVAAEPELALSVGNALFFELLLCSADSSDLRVGVGDTRDGGIIDMPVAGSDP